MSPSITWQCTQFDHLTVHELYAILQLRSEIFMLEQDCRYQDMDNLDVDSFHLMGWLDGVLIAYTRLIPPGLAYPQQAIGRVVVRQSARALGVGKILMQQSALWSYRLFGNNPIKISAQFHLKKFMSRWVMYSVVKYLMKMVLSILKC